MDQLTQQWIKFVKSGYQASRFTRALYDAFYLSPGFIAHYDRDGFVKARFMSVEAIDSTLGNMRLSDRLLPLLKATDAQDLIAARLRIAKLEVSALETELAIKREHIQHLRSQYQTGVL